MFLKNKVTNKFCENCKKDFPFSDDIIEQMIACPFCKADIKRDDVVGELSNLIAKYGSKSVIEAAKSLKIISSEDSAVKIMPDSCDDSNLDSFTDPRDGHVYKTVKIGDQIWFAENLQYDNGDRSICVYDKNYKYLDRFGLLYPNGLINAVIPKGWHLPTENEWVKMIEFVLKDSRSKDVFPLLAAKDWFSFAKSAEKRNFLFATEYQSDEDKLHISVDDRYGFGMVPGGLRYDSYDKELNKHYCYKLGQEANFWISTDGQFIHFDKNGYRIRYHDDGWANYSPNDAYSIRLVKDK